MTLTGISSKGQVSANLIISRTGTDFKTLAKRPIRR